MKLYCLLLGICHFVDNNVIVSFSMQSLSAAHLLTAHNIHSVRGTAKQDSASTPSPVEESVLPPEFQSLLESCKEGHVQVLLY